MSNEQTQITLIEEEPRAVQVALPESSPMGMMLAAVRQGVNIELVEKMMGLQRQWEADEARKAYNTAFAAFKAEAVRVIKNKQVTSGPLNGKSYAELHAVVNAVTPALSKHGLSASWNITKDEPNWIEVTCTLKHSAGHSESVSMGGPPDAGGAKNAIHARASTQSYLSRYTLKAITGLAEQDDDTDGNPPVEEVPPGLLADARAAAANGWKAFADYIKSLSPQDRSRLEPESDNLKAMAKAADKAKQEQ